jgi:MRG/HSF-type DNA-binding
MKKVTLDVVNMNNAESTLNTNSRHELWWHLKGNYFSRENPQLHKIRPRPRPERHPPPVKETAIPDSHVSAEDASTRFDNQRLYGAIALGKSLELESSLNTQLTFDRDSNEDEHVAIAERAPMRPESDATNVPYTGTTRLTLYDNEDDVDGKLTASIYDTAFPIPRNPQSFPVLLHKFISECSKSDPDIVQWNTTRSAFNVEIHHPKLSVLLLQYFQHGNYQSLRRMLNYHGFQRDEEGFYKNDSFSEGNFKKIVGSNDRRRKEPVKLNAASCDATKPNTSPLNGDAIDSWDNDDMSSTFNHDLSTYDTLKNDEMSFERMDDHNADDKSLIPVSKEDLIPSHIPLQESISKFKLFEKVYVRDSDGVMYIAVIRRLHYGPHYHKRIDTGLADSVRADGKLRHVDQELMWHYYVHFDFWNVNFDRWVSEYNVYEISDKVNAVAQRISQEHRALQLEMRRKVKGKKSFQTVDGAVFLEEWKARLKRIREETNFDIAKTVSPEISQTVSVESDHSAKRARKCFSWTKAALSAEKNYRQKGLTSRSIPNPANGIIIPFALKKIVVQQWEYINQCQMMPCIPAPTTVRHALNMYLESKLLVGSSSAVASEIGTNHLSSRTNSSAGEGVGESYTAESVDNQNNHDIHADSTQAVYVLGSAPRITEEMIADNRNQEWRDMTDGIALLFDEALESRLLYREEIPQLWAIGNVAEYRMKPYSELYGCEHLLRLFIRLPEMLSENLPDNESRSIMAKVNDFIRFLHKNHVALLNQTHRKLNELEKHEQRKAIQMEEKKRKDRNIEILTKSG